MPQASERCKRSVDCIPMILSASRLFAKKMSVGAAGISKIAAIRPFPSTLHFANETLLAYSAAGSSTVRTTIRHGPHE